VTVGVMSHGRTGIGNISTVALHDRLMLLEARKSITEARKALELPAPTTFLGERQYEPFPLLEREE
jgi:hypothetical protein